MRKTIKTNSAMIRDRITPIQAPSTLEIRKIIPTKGFNAMLASLVQEPAFANVKYIDLRGTLSADLNGSVYKDWWGNELHPTLKGFTAVADKFADALNNL